MKKTVMIIITAMLAWALYDVFNSLVETADSENKQVGLEIGHTAPDFELSTLGGEKVKLSDYRGQQVMVNFWATWCPPCRAEMPDMQKLYQTKDIIILAVNLTESKSDVTEFVEVFDLTFPILMDDTGQVAEQYQIQPIPTSYMIDSEGTIQYKAFGAMNYELMVQEFEKMK